MSFIDSTYFVGEINIPNVSANTTAITQAIDQYEKEILIDLLGYKLYSLLIADLSNGEPQTQIYKDLVNGAEFTHSFYGEDITLKWEGLKNTQKQSLIAYYTYYKYIEKDVTHMGGVGNVLPKSEKGDRVSSENKMINAWERMRSLYGKLPIQYRRFVHYPIKMISFTNVIFISEPGLLNFDASAFNFLWANRANYPDWVFNPKWNINRFGI